MKTPKDIARSYVDIGAAKAALPLPRMLLQAVLAGVYIALAGVAASVGTALAGRLAGACIFPAGLAMVIIAGSELFTGNNLMVIPLLEKRITLWQLLRAWVAVYAGNLIGGVLIAALAVGGGTLDGISDAVLATAGTKVSLSFGTAVIRGILCNMLVCTAVWMAMASDRAGGKILCLYMPVMAFVLCGFEHCIANMFYIPAGLFMAVRQGTVQEGLSWGAFFLKNLLPVTIGNILGGMGLGAALRAAYLPAEAQAKA